MSISGVIKSVQDIMRKDTGVDGDAQRISQIGWMLFLKIFDDREREYELIDEKYKSPIPAKFRWRNWAVDPEGMTEEELADFLNNQLFPALKQIEYTEKSCFASDGNGIQIVIANLVPEPIKRKVPWPREDDDDTSKLLRR